MADGRLQRDLRHSSRGSQLEKKTNRIFFWWGLALYNMDLARVKLPVSDSRYFRGLTYYVLGALGVEKKRHFVGQFYN